MQWHETDRPGDKWRTLILAALPYMAVSFAVLWLRWPTLSNNILSFDEPTYFGQAARLNSLSAFIYSFQYRTETKTQIRLIPYLVAGLIDHHNAVLLLHLFGLIAVCVSCWLLIAFSRRFLGGAFPGLASGFIGSIYLVLGPTPGFGVLNARENLLTTLLEYFQTSLILAGLYLVVLAATGATTKSGLREIAVFVAGLTWALAMLIKPSVTLLGPLYILALLFLYRTTGERSRLRQITVLWVSFSLGALLPVALVFSPYLFNQMALAELRFNLIEVNSRYSQGEPLVDRARVLLLAIPPALVSAILPVLILILFRMMRYRKSERAVTNPIPQLTDYAVALLLLCAAGLFVSTLPGHAFIHYLVPIVPVLALGLTGYIGLRLKFLAERGWKKLAIALPIALGLLYFLLQLPGLRLYAATGYEDYYKEDDLARFDMERMVAYIDEHTTANESIWVYYNTPEIYMLASRYPATRNPEAAYLTIYWQEPWFERTLHDLTIDHPALIAATAILYWPAPARQSLVLLVL